MCGRYALSRSPEDLIEEFEVVADHATGQVKQSFNMAPTDPAPVVLTRAPRGSTEPPVRQLRPLVWGLVPSWSKDRRSGARMINARAEEVLDKPAFRKAALSRRLLVPAEGWYEWQREASRRQPYFIRSQGGELCAFAGLYEFWRDPQVADAQDPSAWLSTFTILTRPAEEGLDVIHPRMPLVLDRGLWDQWLDPQITERGEVEAILAAAQEVPEGRFAAIPVSDAVNNVRHDGPELLRPVAD